MLNTRLAEVLGSLSLATDMAAGLPKETALRTSVIATRLAIRAGIQGYELSDVYYAALLRFLGCSAHAHEMAARYAAGDDRRLLGALALSDPARPATVVSAAWRGISAERGTGARLSAFARLASSPQAESDIATSHCELAVLLARQLGMSDAVVHTLGQIYERWDGRGFPAKLRAAEIRRSARVLHLAWRLAAYLGVEGVAAALDELEARSGREFDPELCRFAEELGPALFDGLLGASSWSTFLATEPTPGFVVHGADHQERIATVFGHFADVKSPFTRGHSQRVMELCSPAAERMAVSAKVREQLRLAALLHDLGRVAIANGIWDKPGPLDAMEQTLMQEHAHEAARIVARCETFREVQLLVSMAHERLDGSGYPRRSEARDLNIAARILAAADVYAALLQDRPQRKAHSPAAAVDLLRREVAAGRLCEDAVNAVLVSPARPNSAPTKGPGLSSREVEILGCVAQGLANKEIAEQLGISPSTVKRHLENMFEKIGVRTRAAVTIWAIEHGYSLDG
jgi:HD-GYP domain-containing protein (c-di-GMP phosphodiesterase class II)